MADRYSVVVDLQARGQAAADKLKSTIEQIKERARSAREETDKVAESARSSARDLIRTAEAIAAVSLAVRAVARETREYVQESRKVALVADSWRAVRVATRLAEQSLTGYVAASAIGLTVILQRAAAISAAYSRGVQASAFTAADSGASFGDVRAEGTLSRVLGRSDLGFVSRIGADNVVSAVQDLERIQDPIARAQAAIRSFGADAQTALELAGSGFVTRLRDARNLAEELDGPTRESVQRLRDTFQALSDFNPFDGIRQSYRSFREEARQGITIRIAAVLDSIKESGRNTPSALAFGNDATFDLVPKGNLPDQVPSAAQLVEQLRRGLADLAPSIVSPTVSTPGQVAAAQGIIRSRAASLEGLRQQLSVARSTAADLAQAVGRGGAVGDSATLALIQKAGDISDLEARISVLEKAESFADLSKRVSADISFGQLSPARRRQAEAARDFGRAGSDLFDPLVNREDAATYARGIAVGRSEARRVAGSDLSVSLRGRGLTRTDISPFGGDSGPDREAIANLERAIAEATAGQKERAAAVRQEVEFRSQLVRLIAGPGGELAAAREIARLRLEGAEKEREITQDTAEFERNRVAILREGALEQLRIARERDDRNRQTGGQVFDALLSGGAGVGRFVSGLGLGFGRQAFGNVFAELARGTTGALQLPGQTGADGRPNFLGRVLSGTPFGLDPNKVSLDANTIATQQNTAALLGGRGGSGILGSIPGVFGGGSTSNPFIFSASGRSGGITGPDGLPLGIVGQGLNLGNPNLGLTLGQKIGAAAGIAGGGFLVKSGIQQGGLAGALDIGSGTAGALAALLPLIGVSGPAAPILAGAALGAQVIKGLLPDPRKARARSIQQAIDASRFDFGDTTELFRDISGSGALDKGNVTIVYMPVSTLSPRTFLDHSTEITDAVKKGIDANHPIVETLQGRLDTAAAY